MSDPNERLATEQIGIVHYSVCVLRPDQIDLIAQAVYDMFQKDAEGRIKVAPQSQDEVRS